MRIAILGKSGNISRAFIRVLSNSDQDFLALGSGDLDLRNLESISPTLDKIAPDFIINAAAYTNVEKAETDAAAAYQLNALALRQLAQWCARHDKILIHYSTDYVFDGTGDHEWTEEMPTGPTGVYAASKLAGEEHIKEANCRYLILRTARIYSAAGTNFFTTMLRLMRDRETLSVVDDQIGHPTYAGDVASATLEVMKKAASMPAFPTGIYHMTNQGSVSWYEFTRAIAEECRALGMELKIREVIPISTAAYPSKVQRPINARLSNAKLLKVFGVKLPDWREGLRACIAEPEA